MEVPKEQAPAQQAVPAAKKDFKSTDKKHEKKAVVVQTKPASIKEEKKKVQEVIIEDDHNMEVVDEVDTRASGEDSITVKQKKENAKKMIEMVKKFNAKLKSSMERK